MNTKYNDIRQEPTEMKCGLKIYPLKFLERDIYLEDLFSKYLLYDIKSLNRLNFQNFEKLKLEGKINKKTKFKDYKLKEKNLLQYVTNQYLLDNQIRLVKNFTKEHIDAIKEGRIIENGNTREIPKEQVETLVKFIEDVQNGNIKYSNRDIEIIEMFSVVTHTNDIKITMDGIEIKVDNEFYLLDNQGLEEFREIVMKQNLIFMPKIAKNIESQEGIDIEMKHRNGKEEYDMESIIAILLFYNPNLDLNNITYYAVKAIFHSFLNIGQFNILHNYRANGCTGKDNKDIKVINLTDHLSIKDNPYENIYSVANLSDIGDIK